MLALRKKNISATSKLAAVPTTTGLLARLAVARLESRGINVSPLLAEAGVSRSSLQHRHRIPAIGQIELLRLASRAIGDDWLGLTLAAEFDLREMGMLYYVAASSQSLREALQRLERYARLANEAVTIRVQSEQVLRVGTAYVGVPRHLNHHQMEGFTLAFLRLCRQLLGRKVRPVAVRFIHHRSGGLQTLHRLLGSKVNFDATADEIDLQQSLLDAPSVCEDPFLSDLMIKSCEDAVLKRQSTVGPFRTRVENAIAPLLPHGEAQAVNIARRLNLSRRTFSRRLTEEGLTFSEVLDELRRDLAEEYLAEPTLQTSQIAWLLGYQHPSSFTQACRRWTGATPSAYRRARNSM